MSKQMKVIMETWDRFLIQEQATMTWDRLISTLEAIILVKKGEKGAEFATKIAKLGLFGSADLLELLNKDPNKVLSGLASSLGLVESAYELVTGAKDINDIIQNAASLPDEQRSKAGYLAMLDFDDEYIKIIDDKFENPILNNLIAIVKQKQNSNENIADFNINSVIEDFIQQEFNNRRLSGAPEKKASDVKQQGKAGVAKQRVKQKLSNVNPFNRTDTDIA